MANDAAPAQDLGQHIKELRAEIATLAQKIGEVATDTAEIPQLLRQKAGKVAKNATAAGEQLAKDATAAGSEAVELATQSATAAVGRLENHIARNPMTALLIALGIGFTVGVVTRR